LLESESLETDICIIGAGAAGISIAHELKNLSVNVALVESGTYEPELDTQELYQGQAVGPNLSIENQYLSLSRLRYFGGTTNHWGGWCFPLTASDFTHSLPDDRVPPWPITLAELVPFYQRSSHYLDVPKFFTMLGNQFSEALSFQPDLIRETIWNSSPTRFGPKYREILRHSKNIKIFTRCNLVHIAKHKNSSRVHEIICLKEKKISLKIRAKYFVLACGGVENPRLLMTAGREIPVSPKYLGACFMDHPSILGDHVLVDSEGPWNEFLNSSMSQKRLQQGNRDFNVMRIADNIRKENNLPEIATVFLNEEDEKTQKPYSDPIENLLRKSSRKMKKYSTLTLAEVRPNPECRLKLTSGKDWTGLEKIRLDWSLQNEDMIKIQRAMDTYSKISAAAGSYRVKRLHRKGWAPENYPNSHHMGTTRMATESRWGVVDRDCRLFSTENFFIGGSSVFATGGVATPTLTVVALAIRLSDHLKKLTGVA
jgi:choline dehydrogenase-like flavoprotein